MPNKPEVEIERDGGMRGYEVTIYRENAPVVNVFMGDRGAILVNAHEEGTEPEHGQDTPLKLGRTYPCSPSKVIETKSLHRAKKR